jgi:plasmid stabilization system protein ParE
MDFRVILTPRAQQDLRSVTKFIAEHDRDAAQKFGYKLVEVSLSLNRMPERGRVVPEFDDRTIRELIHRSYRIIYQVDRTLGMVCVLRFWHAARGEPNLYKL